MLRAGQVRDHALARKAAAAAKKEEDAHEDRVVSLLAQASTEDGPWIKERPRVTKAALEAWLASEEVRKGINHMQLEFLKLVVDRIMVELGLIRDAQSLRQTSDPLVWLLHGPPGTGKSHVLGFVRELFDMMGYTYGLDYEVAASQAVNAADLKGKTMHKAFGWKAKGGPPDEGAKREAHTSAWHTGDGSSWTRSALWTPSCSGKRRRSFEKWYPSATPGRPRTARCDPSPAST